MNSKIATAWNALPEAIRNAPEMKELFEALAAPEPADVLSDDFFDGLMDFRPTNSGGLPGMVRGGDYVLISDVRAALAAARQQPAPAAEPFQRRVQPWLMECFGEMIAGDREERNHRFLEEALELVQACGCTAHEAHQLVDYTYGRPWGFPKQEVGGVMVTLAALCLANGLDMHEAGEDELARVWTKVEQIRAKQTAKPKYSPLPAAPATEPDMPAICAALGFDPTNHHNAAKCPYCRPAAKEQSNG